MAKTIGQLTALGATPDDSDNLVIDDSGVTKKVTAGQLKGDCVRSEQNNALSSTVGTKIGTDANQLLGFWNATPVDQPAVTADLLDSLQEAGLIASGAGDTPLNLSAGALTCGAITAGAAGVTSLASTGAVTSSSDSAGLGYAAGAGGTETQLTSKSTDVTLNKVTGKITMHDAALAAGAEVSFKLINSTIGADDLLVVNHVSGGTAGSYIPFVHSVAAGEAYIGVSNASATSRSEAIVIGFAVIKGASA